MPSDSGIWSNAHIKPLAKIVKFVHSQNQKIAIQLGHAGRKASTTAPWLTKANDAAEPDQGGWPDNVWGPSTVPFSSTFPRPKELTLEVRAVIPKDMPLFLRYVLLSLLFVGSLIEQRAESLRRIG